MTLQFQQCDSKIRPNKQRPEKYPFSLSIQEVTVSWLREERKIIGKKEYVYL